MAVYSAGTQVVSSGVVVSGDVFISSASQSVLARGVAQAIIVSSGGIQTVDGVASGSVLQGGFGKLVEPDFFNTPGYIYMSGGVEIVESGGVASGAVARSGGLEEINGGRSISAVISDGGYQQVASRGLASGAVLIGEVRSNQYNPAQPTAEQDLLTLGSALSTTVSSGGLEVVWADGVASATHVFSGGVTSVLSGGRTMGETVESGGRAYVASNGAMSGLTVKSGGSAFAAAGATFAGSVISSGGYFQFLSEVGTSQTYVVGVSSARLDGILIMSGAIVDVIGSVVQPHGLLDVPLDAVLAAPVLVSSAGVVSGAGAIAGAGSSFDAGLIEGVSFAGSLDVESGGAVSAVNLASGAHVLIGSGSLAKATVVSSGGFLDIEFRATGSA